MTAERQTPTAVPESFWLRLATAPAALLLLDYDGTLAPFRVERDRAEPYPGVRSHLRRIVRSGRSRLVIVSGRPAADVVQLLGVEPPPEIWGMHGFERRRHDGRLERQELSAAARELLAEAARLAEATLPLQSLELKPAAVAFHWRGLPSRRADAARRELEPVLRDLVAGSALELHRFDGGLEVRPREIDKGLAIARLLAEAGAGAAIAYLGDDLTDEDAFRALGDEGLAVLVRSEPRPTAARVRIEPPQQLLGFLDRWIETRGAGEHE